MADVADSPAIETGAMFLPLLEELVELISVESWRELWGFVETRSKRFTKVSFLIRFERRDNQADRV